MALRVVGFACAVRNAFDAKPNSQSNAVTACQRGLVKDHSKLDVNSAATAACDTSSINIQSAFILSIAVAKLKQEFPKGSARIITRGRRSEYL